MKPCRRVWGPTRLVIPASGGAPDDPGGGVAVEAGAVAAEEDRAVGAFADGEVDGAGGAGRHRDEDGLAAFAEHGEGAVAAFEAEVFDVGAECFGDAQAVEREQRDQGVVARVGESGDDEHRAELVAVEAGGVRFVVEAGAADVHGGRVLDEAFLFGVAVEAGDGAEPPGDRGAGFPGRFEVAGERFDVRPFRVEQGQVVLGAVAGVLAEIERVGLIGEARSSRPGTRRGRTAQLRRTARRGGRRGGGGEGLALG